MFLRVGMNVQWDADMSVTDMCNEGIRRAYLHPDNVLRASILDDPDGARKNTNDNTPGVIHYEIVPGDSGRGARRRQGRRLGGQVEIRDAEPVGLGGRLGARNGAD